MSEITASQKQTYWQRVQDALAIAGAPNELAESLVQEVENLSRDQQELFYHAEPLDVAKDLSGVERWSDEQVRTYIEHSSRAGRSTEQLAEVSLPSELSSAERIELVRAVLQDEVIANRKQSQPKEPLPLVENVELERLPLHLGLLLSGIFGVAGIAVIIALAIIGLIDIKPAVLLSILTTIVTLALGVSTRYFDAPTGERHSRKHSE